MSSKEDNFGIRTYFDPATPGFRGILKSRLSDFMVNEVDLDGKVVHLTSTTVPADLTATGDAVKESIDESLKNQIEEFLQSNDKALEIPVPDDKDARRNLHKVIEAHFPQLIRVPVQKDDRTRVIQLTLDKQVTGAVRREQATRNRYSEYDFVHCVLYKENMDTMQAVNSLAKYLRTPNHCIQYAGVKDKRAKTSQRISVKIRDPRRVASFKHQNIRVGNFAFAKAPLSLGDLSGNQFRLVIRGLTDPEEVITTRTANFLNGGFINYFGLQRFGTTEISTIEVGKSLLKADWDLFVDLVLKPRKGDHHQVARCREVWAESKDAMKALQALGHRNCVEAALLRGLAKQHANNAFGAIQNIPRNMRTLYVHSYQRGVMRIPSFSVPLEY